MPRKPKPARKGISLRALAEELGVSRPKAKRMIADGMPARRVGESLYAIDLDAAREWFAANEAPGKKRAPVLDPRDPRHTERTAAAAIKRLKLGLDSGNLVRLDDADARVSDECTRVRTRTPESESNLLPRIR